MSRVYQIERIIAKGQMVPLHFRQDAVAASQAAVALGTVDGDAVASYIMPFPGEIVAISYKTSAAATAGSLTIDATIDGTAISDATQTLTTDTSGKALFKRGTHEFNAENDLGVDITTTAAWDATTADLVVTVWAVLGLAGI